MDHYHSKHKGHYKVNSGLQISGLNEQFNKNDLLK
jgi:hypothetical protein